MANNKQKSVNDIKERIKSILAEKNSQAKDKDKDMNKNDINYLEIIEHSSGGHLTELEKIYDFIVDTYCKMINTQSPLSKNSEQSETFTDKKENKNNVNRKNTSYVTKFTMHSKEKSNLITMLVDGVAVKYFNKKLPRYSFVGLVENDSNKMYVGIAVCNPEDIFSKKAGREIAYDRAYKTLGGTGDRVPVYKNIPLGLAFILDNPKSAYKEFVDIVRFLESKLDESC